MHTDTAKRCVAEIQNFLKAWEDVQVKYAEYCKSPYAKKSADWLKDTWEINKERNALRQASINLTFALTDLRQGR